MSYEPKNSYTISFNNFLGLEKNSIIINKRLSYRSVFLSIIGFLIDKRFLRRRAGYSLSRYDNFVDLYIQTNETTLNLKKKPSTLFRHYGQICSRTSRNNRNAECNLQVLICATLIFGTEKSLLLSMSSTLFRACDQAVGQCGAQTYQDALPYVLLVQFDRRQRVSSSSV